MTICMHDGYARAGRLRNSRTKTNWSGGEFAEHAIEVVGLDGAQELLHGAVGGDDGHRRLVGHAESAEHFAWVVTDLRERQPVTLDEVVERIVAADPGDADEVGLTRPAFACLLDRGGFTIAGASTRRPEPEHGGCAGDRRTVERAAANEWRRELQQFRYGDFCGRGS
jgi:hypothetical protein